MGKKALPPKKPKPAQAITRWFDKKSTVPPAAEAPPAGVQPANAATFPRLLAQRQQAGELHQCPAGDVSEHETDSRPEQPGQHEDSATAENAPANVSRGHIDGTKSSRRTTSFKPFSRFQAPRPSGSSLQASNTAGSANGQQFQSFRQQSRALGEAKPAARNNASQLQQGTVCKEAQSESFSGCQTAARFPHANPGKLLLQSQIAAYKQDGAALGCKRDRQGKGLEKGLAGFLSQELDDIPERVGYKSVASPEPSNQPDTSVGARERLIHAVREAAGRKAASSSCAAANAEEANQQGYQSQDGFFEELLLLPPPLYRCRDCTPKRQHDPGKKPLASNLKKPPSACEPATTAVAKSSPSTSSATPKEPSAEAAKKRPRVSFNPAISYVSARSPSCSSCSYGSAVAARKKKSRILGLSGSVQKLTASGRPRSVKRKSLMELLDQVELLIHEPEEASPPALASPSGKENLTAFERASQEIEKASQELLTSQQREQDHKEAVVVCDEQRAPEGQLVAKTSKAWTQGGVFDVLDDNRCPSQALDELEVQLAQQLEEEALNARRTAAAEGLKANADGSPASNLDQLPEAGTSQPPVLEISKQSAPAQEAVLRREFSTDAEQNFLEQQLPARVATFDIAGKAVLDPLNRQPQPPADPNRQASHSPVSRSPQHAQGAAQKGSLRARQQAGDEGVLADVSNSPQPRAASGISPKSPTGNGEKQVWQADSSASLGAALRLDDSAERAALHRLNLKDGDAAQPSHSSGRDNTVCKPAALEADATPDAAQLVAVGVSGKAAQHGTRFIVLEVTEAEQEKLLGLVSTSSGVNVTAHLRDGWLDVMVQEGDLVNLVAELDLVEGSLHAICSYSRGLLITHPDLLLSGTVIAGSYKCPRASVLQERFGGTSGEKAVQGTLLHELFQAALVAAEDPTKEVLHASAVRIVKWNAEKLLDVGMDDLQAIKVLDQGIPAILVWLSRFRKGSLQPLPSITVGWKGGVDMREGFCIEGVADIEESIWAPTYGIKGMIDASIDCAFEASSSAKEQQQGPNTFSGWGSSRPQSGQQTRHSAPDGRRLCRPSRKHMLAPLEFKTGKPHQSHRAQVMLYLLLMEERYGAAMERGLLQYLGQESPEVISRAPYEISALIMQRNQVAAHVAASQELPPTIHEQRTCEHCFQQAACAIIHKGVEDGNAQSAGMGPAFDQQSAHLTPSHTAFLRQWLRLIVLEEGGIFHRRAEIWNLPGPEREQLGRCIANLVYVAGSEQRCEAEGGMAKWMYTFCAAPQPRMSTKERSGATQLLGKDVGEMGFSDQELVVVSVEGKHPCVARAVISELTSNTLSVTTQRRIRATLLDEVDHTWRLDKDEVSSNFIRMRKNILGMMAKGSGEAAKLRRLVADMQAPTFAPGLLELPARDLVTALNAEQQQAVHRVLTAHDYALILGLPGTGKTSTIAVSVIALLAAGRSVLVSAYTNSALDNILLKLAAFGAPVLRLGRKEGVHPSMKPYTPGGQHYPDTSVAGLKCIARDATLVGCTALGVDSPLLNKRVFDMCIIDEAGQITLPTCLGPLLKARAFTLVGDHYQLPPLVQNKAAAAAGLATSLFRHLCEAHPKAMVALRLQYRMAGDIQLLANRLVYNGSLRCGSDAVRDAVLHVELTQALEASYPPWLLQVLSPDRRVLFLDTDAMEAAETQFGDALSNTAEADIVRLIAAALVACKVPPGDICVISPYRSQVALLQRQVTAQNWHEVEVLTVDKCQGRDKPALLLSLVRSNAERSAGRLLADWRRVNVALTRAQKKLVLIGSAQTLASVPLFAELLELVESKGWLIQLPAVAV